MADKVIMSCRAYAKLRGVSPMSVSEAIKAGRLRDSVARGDSGNVIGIKDPVLADQEWEHHSDMMKAPAPVRESSGDRAIEAEAARGGFVSVGDDESGTLGENAADVKYWQAKLAELKYRQETGELVSVKTIEGAIADMIAASKTRLLAIPSRVKQALPHLSVVDVATVEKLVREALEDLAIGKAAE